jgi:hypothetical protein
MAGVFFLALVEIQARSAAWAGKEKSLLSSPKEGFSLQEWGMIKTDL